jgi:hypothetical protein
MSRVGICDCVSGADYGKAQFESHSSTRSPAHRLAARHCPWRYLSISQVALSNRKLCPQHPPFLLPLGRKLNFVTNRSATPSIFLLAEQMKATAHATKSLHRTPNASYL